MKKRTLEVSEETYNKIKDQLAEEEVFEINRADDLIGKKFFFRTVTYHLIGEVDRRLQGTNFFLLRSASWVASSGRFMNAIKYGTLDEVEPVGEAYINLESVIDFFPWRHALPTEQT